MKINFHPHAIIRMHERCASEAEVIETIKSGESFAAKHNRYGFRKDFVYNSIWRGKRYETKQVEVISVREGEDLIVITVLVKYF